MRLPLFRALCAILFLLLPSLVSAQCNGPGYWSQMSADDQRLLERKADTVRFGTGNLWRATRGETALTVVGTMHLPDQRHADLLDRIRPAFDTADLLLVEATLSDQEDLQVFLARNPDILTITTGPTLPELVDEQTWAAIQTAAAARGVPGVLAAKMQPWFLSLTLSLPPCAMSAMAQGQAGLDTMLMQEAASRGIPVRALEPWQDMLAFLREGDLEQQLDALRLSLIDPSLQDAVIVSLIEFYFSERSAMGWQLGYAIADAIPNMAIEDFNAQMAVLEQRLLIDRNANWIPVIEAAAAEHDDILIGFGAAHLFDETGVLALLERNGWTVTRQ